MLVLLLLVVSVVILLLLLLVLSVVVYICVFLIISYLITCVEYRCASYSNRSVTRNIFIQSDCHLIYFFTITIFSTNIFN